MDYGLLGGIGAGIQTYTKVKGEEEDRNMRIMQMKNEIEERKRLRERQGLLDARDSENQAADRFSKGLLKTDSGFEFTPEEKEKRSLDLDYTRSKTEKERADAIKAKRDALNPKPKTDTELKAATDLRKEYQGRPGVKEFNTVKSAYSKIQSAAKNPSAAGDLSLIFAYMKLLDPNSTVREGEFANAQNAAGVPDQVKNMANKIVSGERLNPSQRQDFINQARGVYGAQAEQLKAIEDEFGGLSKRYGVDPGLIYQSQTGGLIPQENVKEVGGKKFKKVQGGWEEI